MKNFSNFLFFTLFAVALSACSSNQLELPENKEHPQTAPKVSNNEVYAGDINIHNIQLDAKEHFDLLKRSILATQAYLPITKSNNNTLNPLGKRLSQLEIIDGDNIVSFFQLDLSDKLEFLEDWVIIQAQELSAKLAIHPELKDYVKEQNMVFKTTLDEEVIQTRTSGYRVKNNNVFFTKLQERLNSIQHSNKSTTLTRSIGNIDAPKVDPQIVINTIKDNSRIGDIMLTIPSYNRPWIYANLGENTFTVGHGALIVDKVHKWTTPKSKVTLGSNIGYGVIMEEIEYWAVQSYIMGIQIVSWKKEKSTLVGLAKKRWTKVIKPLDSNQRKLLVAKAKEFEGRPYVRIEEFPFAKYYAPLRFTCTCLIWYCCMELFDIDISPFWSPVVSPSDVYLSEHTYVRARITE